ncbi:MAG: Pycsar system effector family protein [Bacillota bacterium]
MIERLRWQVRTCEGWIANADAKAAVIVGLNGALVAGLLAGGRGAVTGGLAGGWATRACDTVFLAAVAWSILWAGLTVLPNVSGGPSGGSVSHFAEVVRLSLEDFRKASRALVGLREIEALESQVYVLSRISSLKFRRLRWSIGGLMAGLVAGLVSLIL